jgi:NADPH-dependent curcumin reductase CurA
LNVIGFDALKKAAPKGADIFFDNVSFIIKFEIFQIQYLQKGWW